MYQLPKWSLTETFPAFYDMESGTAIEQTAKLYGAMRTLIDEHNKFVELTNKGIEDFMNGTIKDADEFKMMMSQQFQDFIDVVELKLDLQDKKIEELLKMFQENVSQEIINVIEQMKENGELTESILIAFSNLDERTKKLETKNNFIPISATQGTMQAIYRVVESYLHNNEDLVYAHYPSESSTEIEKGYNAMSYENGTEKITIQRDGVSKTGSCINCSSFVHMVLMGVPFEKSMYNPEYNALLKNKLGSAGYCFNMYGEPLTSENYKKYIFARNMATRFEELGLGFRPNDDFSNISPGDVVFFSSLDGKTAELNRVDHVGIVLAKHIAEFDPTLNSETITSTLRNNAEVLYTIAEVVDSASSLVTVRTIAYDSERIQTKGLCYVGRPLYSGCPDGKKLLGYHLGSETPITFDTTEWNLYSQDIVTICFEYTPTGTNEYVNLYVNDVSVRRYIPALTRNSTELELGKTQKFVIPVRLSDFGSVNGDDSINKINKIRIASIKDSVVNQDLSNVSIWYGLNGDFVTSANTI